MRVIGLFIEAAYVMGMVFSISIVIRSNIEPAFKMVLVLLCVKMIIDIICDSLMKAIERDKNALQQKDTE